MGDERFTDTTRRTAKALVVAFVVVLSTLGARAGFVTGAQPDRPQTGGRPNIVFVLTDDLDWSLVTQQFMPHVLQLQRQGETFTHYIVSDSLCCPSRTSILTGLYPHDSGVFSNRGRDGGYRAFTDHKPNLERRTFAVVARRAGYLTSMMGKYLNGYGAARMTTHVPAGWSDWHVAGNAYREFNYDLNENGTIVHYGAGPPPRANADRYLTDVLAARATAFIDRAASAHRPFVMEVATFAPHYPYVPAPRDARAFPGLGAPRDPSFNTGNIHAPEWLGQRERLTPGQVGRIDAKFRRRAEAIVAVDQLVAAVQAEVVARGLARNTYIIFSSDNGYHMGQHRLLPGKETAFDTDIRVPLIISGPGVPRDTVVPEMVQNTDLYPTFVQLAGHDPGPGMDGHSLLPLLHPSLEGAPLSWPTAALIEHHGPTDAGDPDFENGELGGNPPSYEAVRLSNRQFGDAVYVEYTFTGRREYYDIDSDPFERNNIYSRLGPRSRAELHRILIGLERCHNARACWAARDPQPHS